MVEIKRQTNWLEFVLSLGRLDRTEENKLMFSKTSTRRKLSKSKNKYLRDSPINQQLMTNSCLSTTPAKPKADINSQI